MRVKPTSQRERLCSHIFIVAISPLRVMSIKKTQLGSQNEKECAKMFTFPDRLIHKFSPQPWQRSCGTTAGDNSDK